MNVLYLYCILEQWCYFFGGEACNATTNFRDEKSQFGMLEVNPKSWTVDYDANLVNLY